MKFSELRAHWFRQSSQAIWSYMLSRTRSLEPFLTLATETFSELLGTPQEKVEQYRAAFKNAFQNVDDWRLGRSKRVKKNENKLDSAISYIRNGALRRETSGLLMSPVARNAAGCMRVCLHVATFNYSDDQLPGLAACGVFDIAAVRTLFPFDTGTLVHFAPGSIHAEDGNIDNFNAMLTVGAQILGIEAELAKAYDEAWNLRWQADEPKPMVLPADLKQRLGGARNLQLHFQAMQAIHKG